MKISDIIIGQEAVVPYYGLGRVLSVTKNGIEVKPYVCGYPMIFDPKNVRLVALNIEELK